jgi:predicted deacylase
MLTSVDCQPKWAASAGGKPIALHKKLNANARPILFLGGVHGDEPEGVWLAEEALKWLGDGGSEPRHPWCLITCLNPDGYEKNERVNSRGVDLNRNFPERNWSPDHKAPRYNPGPSPGSEPEVQALVRLIDEIHPRVIIHCHSWRPCIVLTGEAEVETARTLSVHSGYEFTRDIGYPTPGSLGEYGWRERKIPVICIEIGEKTPREKMESLFRKSIHEIFGLATTVTV